MLINLCQPMLVLYFNFYHRILIHILHTPFFPFIWSWSFILQNMEQLERVIFISTARERHTHSWKTKETKTLATRLLRTSFQMFLLEAVNKNKRHSSWIWRVSKMSSNSFGYESKINMLNACSWSCGVCYDHDKTFNKTLTNLIMEKTPF